MKEVAILGLVAIAIVALWKEVDGVLLASIVGGISGLAGYALGQKKKEISAESPSPEDEPAPG